MSVAVTASDQAGLPRGDSTATAGLADGWTYIGDIDLKPETSLSVDVGLRLKRERVALEGLQRMRPGMKVVAKDGPSVPAGDG